MPAAGPLDIVTDRIRDRVARRREDWLTATYHVVALMDDRQARVVLDTLLALPYLSAPDADLAQLTAQRLNQPLQWRHISLTGCDWQPGRGP